MTAYQAPPSPGFSRQKHWSGLPFPSPMRESESGEWKSWLKTQHSWNEKTLAPWKKNYDKPKQHIKKQRYYFPNKGPSSQIHGFSCSHVWMWELDHKKGWAPKNWCFWTVVMEKTLESPLDSKKIKLVNSKGNQSWIFIGRPDAEAEAQILWPPDAKSWLIRKDPDAGKD